MGARLTRIGPPLGSGGYGDKIPNLLLHLPSLDTTESLSSQTLTSVAQAAHPPVDHSGEPKAPFASPSLPLSFSTNKRAKALDPSRRDSNQQSTVRRRPVR
ncbi:hypothetical protein V6N11_012972 [Hibiscus sabdariffa]|uniref:Uncharacterized protein n=1 Tax=Hibiscus sabdariffa TaxID=183260 RepID=A0ABR2A060_9ROSI